MAEDLHHLLALHHLLDIAVDAAEVFLLLHEEAGGVLGEILAHKEDHRHHHAGEDGEGHVQDHHADENADDGDEAAGKIRQALGDHLPQGVDVVGVDGHDVPVGVGIEVGDGQALHVLEDLDTEVPQRPLGHRDHDAALGPGAEDADAVDGGDADQGRRQGPEVPAAGGEHGVDIVVDEALQEEAPLDGSQGRSHDAEGHPRTGPAIVPEDQGEDPL